MNGITLGGIDPSIVRELSGVYKPFVKAFKELVSNAYDADADHVHVRITDDFSSIIVEDDGTGMTPFEFRNDFTRIGGGSRRWLGERTRKGRLRIGSKGIGFLALARYCSTLEVVSGANRPFRLEQSLPDARPVELDQILGFAVPAGFFRRFTFTLHRSGRGASSPVKRSQYKVDAKTRTLRFEKSVSGPLHLALSFDCRNMGFRAFLNFDRLLELADKADLDKLSDFATIEFFQEKHRKRRGRTQIVAHELKSFVKRELQSERRKGYVRNIASRCGLDAFRWHLARSTPIRYARSTGTGAKKALALVTNRKELRLAELRITHAGQTTTLERPIYPVEPEALPLHDDILIPVAINEAGLRAAGFIAGYESVIFPAEYRGVVIRVRGVAIGDPSFLGAEHLLTGANKAALSQITGEINVLSGLDAVDALNPGRESFYEESEQFKTLRRNLIGDGETVSGVLASAISAVLRRSQVRSSLKDVIGRACLRRRVLDDIAAAVAELIATGAPIGQSLRTLTKRKHSQTNGLADAPDWDFSGPPRIGGLKVLDAAHLAEPVEIDYKNQVIRLDMARHEWDWTLVLFNRRLQVANKRGGPMQPLGELNLKEDTFFLNWEHPIRSQMDERAFLRTAVAWILAREAAAGDADQMMELALRLLSFRSGVADG